VSEGATVTLAGLVATVVVSPPGAVVAGATVAPATLPAVAATDGVVWSTAFDDTELLHDVAATMTTPTSSLVEELSDRMMRHLRYVNHRTTARLRTGGVLSTGT
jgi:hypothetical protein